MSEPLEKFGSFIVQNLRDKMLFDLDMLLRGAWKSPETQELQRQVSALTDAQKSVVRELVEKIATGGMHDLLFAIQEEADAGGPIKLLVDAQEVAKLSDGLHGEIFGEDGWIVRFSKYPSPAEIERSQWAKTQIQKMLEKRNEDEG